MLCGLLDAYHVKRHIFTRLVKAMCPNYGLQVNALGPTDGQNPTHVFWGHLLKQSLVVRFAFHSILEQTLHLLTFLPILSDFEILTHIE